MFTTDNHLIEFNYKNGLPLITPTQRRDEKNNCKESKFYINVETSLNFYFLGLLKECDRSGIKYYEILKTEFITPAYFAFFTYLLLLLLKKTY